MAKKKKKKRRRGSGKSVSPQSRERTYQSGLSYFREGEYERAIRAWRGIVGKSEPELASQLAEAYFRSAMSKYESGDMKAVISELRSALKYDAHTQPVYLFHIGLAYHRMEKFPQAISHYTRAIQAAPQVERYRYHLGLARLQNGEIQESIELFESVKDVYGRIGEALAYISQGDYERALAVLGAKNDGSELEFLKGLTYLAQGDDRKAKRLLKAARGDGMGNGVSSYYLGLAHTRTDAIPSAIKAWEDASQRGLDIGFMKDDMANVYRQLAARYFDRGNLGRVVKIWEKLVEVEPGDNEARRNLVHAYFLRGNDYAKAEKLTHAIRCWKKAWEFDSTNVDIAHNLALAHEKRSELPEAAEYWKAAVKGWKRQMSANRGEKEILKARMYTVHTHLANISLEADNIGRAIAEYRQALRYAPEAVETIVKLADLYMMQGSADKAIQHLSRARRLSPTDTDALQQLSLAYMMKGNFSRSVECMKEILKIDPGNRLYQEMVGQYYLRRAEDSLGARKHEAALRFLEEGLQVCPGNIELRTFVGAVYLDMGDKPKAEAAFQETIAIGLLSTKTYIAIARRYLNNDMMDDAEAYFAKAIEPDPDSPDTYIAIASEYCHLDICEKALEHFEKAKKARPNDPSVLMEIVDKLLARGCPKYGLRYAKELMDMAPKDPTSYLLLGFAYHSSDMNDEAMDTLIEGTDIAEQAGNDRMIDEIESLFRHIEFEKTFGGFRSAWSDLIDEFDDEEEW